MATIETPNWESGHIHYPDSLWGILIESLLEFKDAVPRYTDGRLLGLQNNKFSLIFVNGLIYWYQSPGESTEPNPLKEFFISCMKNTKWTTYTGGAVYGGKQDENYMKYLFGPLGKEYARRYKVESRKSKAEGGTRESDVIQTHKKAASGDKKPAVRSPSVPAAPNSAGTSVDAPVRAPKRPKAIR